MALLTTLKLKDVSDDYKVADFHLHMSRSYNQFNPESAPSCESIEMTVVAPSTDDYTIYEWYNNDSLLSGRKADVRAARIVEPHLLRDPHHRIS